jgi:hypothetical protein
MGIKQAISKTGNRIGNGINKLAKLSSDQVKDIEDRRNKYLTEMPDPNDSTATALTEKLLAANGVEIYNAYLPQIDSLYVPVSEEAEYDDRKFDAGHNIRYFKITKWVSNKQENNIEKLINVYEVLSDEECNIALVFHRGVDGSDVYLAVTNTLNSLDNNDANSYKNRLEDAIRGNFPGAEWADEGRGIIPCLNNNLKYSVASATNIPTEKSEKFISQTIEKLLDGVVPKNKSEEYTIILLATPIQDVDERKLRLEEIYSGLAPYAGWSTNFSVREDNSVSSSFTAGINVGASAGVQNGNNSSITNSNGTTDSSSTAEGSNASQSQTNTVGNSDSVGSSQSNGTSAGNTETTGMSHSNGMEYSNSDSAGVSVGNKSIVGANYQHGYTRGRNFSDSTNQSIAESLTKTATETASKNFTRSASEALSSTVGKSLVNTLGKAVTKTAAVTNGVFKATNLGVNFGANFARSSSVTATIGKDEGITQNFTNYNIKHSLELLEEQMKRYEESSALGMWDFAAYILSEDSDIAENVAHSYIALTEGEKSYMSHSSVNFWRGDLPDSSDAEEICTYLRELRHPIFGLNPEITSDDPSFNVYPAIVTATTALTGKELAYSLNFPRKSIAGLPVLECAEFGRNVITYDDMKPDPEQLQLGKIYHMHHEERTPVSLSKKSLASHVFITGSTGSGKSNTVYQILDEAERNNVKFLVIEPAKGEYKDVFGNDSDVSVYGTNPNISELLRIDPFSFPKGIHVYEHMDRLVEIFNVCWPMYAAMPAVLKSAIEQSYADCGWDLRKSTNEYGDDLFPSFSDVARNIKTIIDSSEYDSENKGAYKGSLLTRLKSLTNGINGMIFTRDALSDEELFDKNVIIDLSRVGSSETKSLLMGMLVLKLQEHRMTEIHSMNSGLKHLTVLEEAHNLLKRTSSDQPVEGGNLLGKSVEMISNAIAEMRTYGEGFVIVDQAPGLLDMAAIRNTNTKIIMRLPDQEDRELVGRSANLNDDQIIELAKLPCGVAAIYQNEWVQPVLCKIQYFETPKSQYSYNCIGHTESRNDVDERIEIAEMLSNGTKIDEENILKDIRPKMQGMQIDSSVQVTIMEMLQNTPEEPRMTKLAPIFNDLFPQVTDSIQRAYNDARKPEEWTRQAEKALLDLGVTNIADQVRRDIIQGCITYYIFIEKGNEKALKEWSNRGELR